MFYIQRQQLKIKDQTDPPFCLSVLVLITWQRKSHFTASHLRFSLLHWHLCIAVSVCVCVCVCVLYVCSVFKDLSEHLLMLYLDGFFFSLLLLCGMAATISTARTLTVHRMWIIRWVRFTRIHLLHLLPVILFFIWCHFVPKFMRARTISWHNKHHSKDINTSFCRHQHSLNTFVILKSLYLSNCSHFYGRVPVIPSR